MIVSETAKSNNNVRIAGETVQSKIIKKIWFDKNLEHWVFSELVNEGLPLPQFVIVSEHSLKKAAKGRLRYDNHIISVKKAALERERDHNKFDAQNNAKIWKSNCTSAKGKREYKDLLIEVWFANMR